VSFDGEVHIGGNIASVGQRLLDTTSKMLIKRFFTKFSASAL
jgi:carbon monoxide dehydrogenase subunit G